MLQKSMIILFLVLAMEVLKEIRALADTDPERLHASPVTRPIGRPDEVGAARHPVMTWPFEEKEKGDTA